MLDGCVLGGCHVMRRVARPRMRLRREAVVVLEGWVCDGFFYVFGCWGGMGLR